MAHSPLSGHYPCTVGVMGVSLGRCARRFAQRGRRAANPACRVDGPWTWERSVAVGRRIGTTRRGAMHESVWAYGCTNRAVGKWGSHRSARALSLCSTVPYLRSCRNRSRLRLERFPRTTVQRRNGLATALHRCHITMPAGEVPRALLFCARRQSSNARERGGSGLIGGSLIAPQRCTATRATAAATMPYGTRAARACSLCGVEVVVIGVTVGSRSKRVEPSGHVCKLGA